VHLIENPWPEMGQLCGSYGFKRYCESVKLTPEAHAICRACGLPTAGPSAHGESYTGVEPAPCSYRHHPQLLNTVLLPPEEAQEHAGLPAWEAPYVWETNY